MSSLWTPDGEYPVGRDAPAGGGASGPDREPPAPDKPPDPGADAEVDEAAVLAQIEEARARVAEVPAELIVTNHAMGLYELAAIHLSSDPPDLSSAALAIDGFGCLVEGLGDRLGPDAVTLRDALAQIRVAFVQIKGTVGGEPAPAEQPPG